MENMLRITQKERNDLNTEISRILFAVYYSKLPLKEMFNAINKLGFVVIQEDGTYWEGAICGDQGRATCMIARAISEQLVHETSTYAPIENSCLIFSWYKMESGRYEVTGYIA